MSKQREALEMALQALEEIATNYPADWELDICVYAKNLLREALAEPEQEPVAWMCPHDPERETAFSWRAGMCESSGCGHQRVPLYTTPPARKPLTDEEIMKTAKETQSAEPGRDGYILPFAFARAIERAHGITE